jgi:hypothetical protein
MTILDVTAGAVAPATASAGPARPRPLPPPESAPTSRGEPFRRLEDFLRHPKGCAGADWEVRRGDVVAIARIVREVGLAEATVVWIFKPKLSPVGQNETQEMAISRYVQHQA